MAMPHAQMARVQHVEGTFDVSAMGGGACSAREHRPRSRARGPEEHPVSAQCIIPLPPDQAPAKRRPRTARGTKELSPDPCDASTRASSSADSYETSTTSAGCTGSRASSIDRLHDSRAGLRALRESVQRRRRSAVASVGVFHRGAGCVEVSKNNWSLQFADGRPSDSRQSEYQEVIRRLRRDILRARPKSDECCELQARLEAVRLQMLDKHGDAGQAPQVARRDISRAPLLEGPSTMLPALLSPPQLKHAGMHSAEFVDVMSLGSSKFDLAMARPQTPRF